MLRNFAALVFLLGWIATAFGQAVVNSPLNGGPVPVTVQSTASAPDAATNAGMKAATGVAPMQQTGGTVSATTTPATGTPGTGPLTPSIENDDERAAFKAGREFVFTTGNNGVFANPGLSVPANSVLNARFCNGGTKTWYIAPFGRFFDTTSTVTTEYFGASNPDALTTSQAATLTGCGATAPNTCNLSYGSNINPSVTQTDISMQFGVGSVMTCNGGATCVPSGNGNIYPGAKNEISKPRGLPPGKCFGQTAVGQNNANGLGTAAAYFTFRAYIYSDQ